MAARWAHNPKVAGSSPAPATRRVDTAPEKTSGAVLSNNGYFEELASWFGDTY